MMTIEINRVPRSQNQRKHNHWGSRLREKKYWERLILPYGYLWRARCGNQYATKVHIVFFFPDQRRRDIDNFSHEKGILDGLCKAGIIEDDSVKKISVSYELKIGAGARKTVIVLTKGDCDEERNEGD